MRSLQLKVKIDLKFIKIEVEKKPFSKEISKKFLKTGSRVCDIETNEAEIEDAVNTFRGIHGWLTYYGNFRSLGYSHEKAKEIVFNMAKALINDELKQLSENQRLIIKSLSLVEQIGWKNLKNLVESLGKRRSKIMCSTTH